MFDFRYDQILKDLALLCKVQQAPNRHDLTMRLVDALPMTITRTHSQIPQHMAGALYINGMEDFKKRICDKCFDSTLKIVLSSFRPMVESSCGKGQVIFAVCSLCTGFPFTVSLFRVFWLQNGRSSLHKSPHPTHPRFRFQLLSSLQTFPSLSNLSITLSIKPITLLYRADSTHGTTPTISALDRIAIRTLVRSLSAAVSAVASLAAWHRRRFGQLREGSQG